MADEADMAAEHEDKFLALAIRQARSPLTLPEGFCLNCDEELDSPRQRFCDHECARDWQRRQETLSRQGLR